MTTGTPARHFFGPMADRRVLLRQLGGAAATGMMLAVLPGCGFQLRQAPRFSFKSIYTNIAPTSVMGAELRRNLAAIGNVEVITDPLQQKNAEVILDVLQEVRQKNIVGVNASGQVREFQLRLTFKFRLRTPQGRELIPDTEMQQQRDISFSESAVLSKEAEEVLLYRNMQTDLVQQLMRRLAAVKDFSNSTAE